jgi:uncharacterized membrane protein
MPKHRRHHRGYDFESSLRRAETVEQLTEQNVETIAKMESSTHTQSTFGEALADGFARIVGSWTFIVVQAILLALWIVLNVIAWMKHWDPYPFILLNLGLSFQAAFAAPIIMMSQNRQGRLADRRNQLDLQINLLAEQENTEMLRMLRLICGKLQITLPNEAAVRGLEQSITPAKVADQIERSENEKERKAREAKERHGT